MGKRYKTPDEIDRQLSIDEQRVQAALLEAEAKAKKTALEEAQAGYYEPTDFQEASTATDQLAQGVGGGAGAVRFGISQPKFVQRPSYLDNQTFEQTAPINYVADEDLKAMEKLQNVSGGLTKEYYSGLGQLKQLAQHAASLGFDITKPSPFNQDQINMNRLYNENKARLMHIGNSLQQGAILEEKLATGQIENKIQAPYDLTSTSAYNYDNIKDKISVTALHPLTKEYNDMMMDSADTPESLKTLNTKYKEAYNQLTDLIGKAVNPREKERLQASRAALKKPVLNINWRKQNLEEEKLKHEKDKHDWEVKKAFGSSSLDIKNDDIIVGAANLFGNPMEYDIVNGKQTSYRFAGTPIGAGKENLLRFEKNKDGSITAFVETKGTISKTQGSKTGEGQLTASEVSYGERTIPFKNARSLISAIAAGNPTQHKEADISRILHDRKLLSNQGELLFDLIVPQYEQAKLDRQKNLELAYNKQYSQLYQNLENVMSDIGKNQNRWLNGWKMGFGWADIEASPGTPAKKNAKGEIIEEAVPGTSFIFDVSQNPNVSTKKKDSKLEIQSDERFFGSPQYQILVDGNMVEEDLSPEEVKTWMTDNQVLEYDSKLEQKAQEYNNAVNEARYSDTPFTQGESVRDKKSSSGTYQSGPIGSTNPANPVTNQQNQQSGNNAPIMSIPPAYINKTFKNGANKTIDAQSIAEIAQQRGISFNEALKISGYK